MVKLIKVNDDLVRLVNGIKIRCLKEGKPVPSTNVITRFLVRKIKEDEVLLYNEFIKFK